MRYDKIDIFQILDNIEYRYQRHVNKRTRAVLRPVLLLTGFAVMTVLVVVAAVPALLYLKLTDE